MPAREIRRFTGLSVRLLGISEEPKGPHGKRRRARERRSDELAVPQSTDFAFVPLSEKKEARNKDQNPENEHRHVGQEDLESDRAPGGGLVHRPRQDVCSAIVAR